MKHQEIFTGRIGRIDEAPYELSNGNCVVNFSVAETPRVKQGDNWVDGETIWTNVAIFGDEARNLIRSVKPGTFVTVVGTRKATSYKDKDTQKDVVTQSVTADEVSVAITKFSFIEGIGNVNYAKDGKPAATKAPAKTAPKSTPAAAATAGAFEAPEADEADLDDPFQIG